MPLPLRQGLGHAVGRKGLEKPLKINNHCTAGYKRINWLLWLCKIEQHSRFLTVLGV